MHISEYARVILLLAGLAAIPINTGRAGEEAPSVNVQANGPGWITVTYSHSGTNGAWGYRIERQGGDSVTLHSPNGQWTDSHLTPGTTYSYTVCAIYEDRTEACAGPFPEETQPAPGRPFNFDPPRIVDVAVNENSIKVFWGPTGDYPTILVHLSDPRGNVDQRKIRNVPNGSQSFVGLRPGVRYRLILKGYSKLGSTLPWSPDVFITTALPPVQLPPPPPSKPTLTVKALDPKTVSLDFAVKISSSCTCKFLVYRDGKQVAAVAPRSDLGGLKGSYTDAVELWERAHDYRVCFLSDSPTAKVCSITVAGPPPSIDVQAKPPADIDVRKPIDPEDLGITPKPRPGFDPRKH